MKLECAWASDREELVSRVMCKEDNTHTRTRDRARRSPTLTQDAGTQHASVVCRGAIFLAKAEVGEREGRGRAGGGEGTHSLHTEMSRTKQVHMNRCMNP